MYVEVFSDEFAAMCCWVLPKIRPSP